PADTVLEADPIDKVVKVLLRSHYKRVLVLDRSGHISGIISPKDLIRGLMGEERRSGSMLHALQIMQKQVEDLKTKLDTREHKIKWNESFFQSSDYIIYSVDSNVKIILAYDKLSLTLGYRPGDLL